MPTVAEGIRKVVSYKKQSALGSPAIGAGGQILRRESAVFQLNKANYENTEIVTHQQSTGARHGLQSTVGKLEGLLSGLTYSAWIQSALRRDFTAASATTGALTNVTAAVTVGAQGTFTRGTGSYLTDGFKVGDVVRWTGWATTGVPNNSHNFQIIGLTALVMTVVAINGVAVGPKATGDSVTCTTPGKKTWVPTTGHTDDFYTVEEWYPDVARSEVYSDLKVGNLALDLPASGNVKASFDLMGLKRTLDTTQQMTSPSAATTSDVLTAVQGVVCINGVQYQIATGLQINIEQGLAADGPVIGSNYSPDISRGRIKVSGQISAFFTDAALQTLFDAETAVSLVLALAADTTAAAHFIGISLPKIKLFGDAPDDGEKGILRTYPFTAEIEMTGGAGTAHEQTIISMQDSLA